MRLCNSVEVLCILVWVKYFFIVLIIVNNFNLGGLKVGFGEYDESEIGIKISWVFFVIWWVCCWDGVSILFYFLVNFKRIEVGGCRDKGLREVLYIVFRYYWLLGGMRGEGGEGGEWYLLS